MAREPARSGPEAEQRYKRIIAQPLTCVTKAIWVASHPLRGPEQERTLLLTGPNPGAPVRLKRDEGLPVYLTAYQQFALVPDPRWNAGEWKASTRQYGYEVLEDGENGIRPVIQWHWHPGSGNTTEPHVHVRTAEKICGMATRRLHLPSERVAFESIVLFLIDELGVIPQRQDWRKVTQDALQWFVRFRTWPRSAPPPETP
ncbi:MAG: hypothetical protein H0V12_02260 [Chloroflexi bacterium]|nr:hypothetical protein [Chloroflexota bacterium]